MGGLSELSRSIQGRVAIVTGAASGMGRATARVLSDEGARVAVVDINTEGVNRVVDEIQSEGGFAQGYAIDLTNPEKILPLVSSVRSDLGEIDILINNAGISIGGPIDSPNFEDLWQATFSINLDAQMRLIRACLEDLKRKDFMAVHNFSGSEAMSSDFVKVVKKKYNVATPYMRFLCEGVGVPF